MTERNFRLDVQMEIPESFMMLNQSEARTRTRIVIIGFVQLFGKTPSPFKPNTFRQLSPSRGLPSELRRIASGPPRRSILFQAEASVQIGGRYRIHACWSH